VQGVPCGQQPASPLPRPRSVCVQRLRLSYAPLCAAPTLADLDGNGKMEIILGTGMVCWGRGKRAEGPSPTCVAM
jgi:hypothetical protein